MCDSNMIITRKWAMPSGDTLSIKPIFELFKRYHKQHDVVIDAFAKDCKIGTITNDLNPDCDTTYHLDALSFLAQFESNKYDFLILDPPYSITQATSLYKSFGKEKLKASVSNMKYWSSIKNEAARILKPNGYCMYCGWNSNGLGKSRGFELDEVLICAHGGSRNDTIVTIEHKIKTLFDDAN